MPFKLHAPRHLFAVAPPSTFSLAPALGLAPALSLILALAATRSALAMQLEGGHAQAPSQMAAANPADRVLAAAVSSAGRPQADRQRDRFRHPEQTLAFWGVRPGITVIDLQPGGGYWTEILAPYAARTGGVYVAGVADLDNPKLSAGARRGRASFEAKHADPRYGQIRYVGFGPVSGPLAAPGSVDLIITSREIHNWLQAGYLQKAMADCFEALKPGGVLAVEEHRADPRAQVPNATDGYVAVRTVVDAATRAGLRLDGVSQVNANPSDTKDYPFGVWTLPPTRQSAPDGQSPNPSFDHAKYDAIGESDRMTLRFRKPG